MKKDDREVVIPLTDKQIKKESSKIKHPGMRFAYVGGIVATALANAEVIRAAQIRKKL